MKTRIIKTDIWSSDEFNRLSNESKLLYLTMLTSPEIGLIEVFKISDRVLIFYTGFTLDQLNLAKDQLVMNGFVDFFDGWVCLRSEIGYVASNYRGAKNEIAKNREIETIPEHVRNHFNIEINEHGLGNTSSYQKSGTSYKHRKIAEKLLGRSLKSNEIVHHIDHDKSNNSKSNLCVMYVSDHNDYHLGKIKLSEIPYVIKLDTLSSKNDTTINLNLNLNNNEKKNDFVDKPVDNYRYDDGKAKEFFESVKRK
mgnify:FL=1